MASATLSPVFDLAPLNLTINEVFHSIQGESTFAGRPCLFIRLTACDLRCTYCDTEYAFYEGKKRPVVDLLNEALNHPCQLVEVTGGEPLLQKNVHPLMTALCDGGKTVLLETSGAHDIAAVDSRVHRIMDLKCPSSGESGRNRAANLPLLTPRDEVKFVAGSEEDCLWALEQIRKGLAEDGWPTRVAAILFSPVFGKIDLRFLAETLLAVEFPPAVAEKIRLQVQMHKLIWEPTARGV